MKQHLNTLIIAFAIILFGLIAANAFKYKYKSIETIGVTGLAEKNFESDQIVWSGNYSRKTMDLKETYSMIKDDEQKIKLYLKSKGIAEGEMVFSSISINRDFQDQVDANGRIIGRTFTGYSLTQSVTVDSKDLDKVEKISREVTELIENGIEFNSSTPSYYYSKLSELKLDLLAKAAADARQRAETIASNSGGKLGDVRNSNMGVFQITGQDSNEDFSYGGAFNTSSRLKKASITVRTEYGIN